MYLLRAAYLSATRGMRPRRVKSSETASYFGVPDPKDWIRGLTTLSPTFKLLTKCFHHILPTLRRQRYSDIRSLCTSAVNGHVSELYRSTNLNAPVYTRPWPAPQMSRIIECQSSLLYSRRQFFDMPGEIIYQITKTLLLHPTLPL